jgi:hypothetical protein
MHFQSTISMIDKLDISTKYLYRTEHFKNQKYTHGWNENHTHTSLLSNVIKLSSSHNVNILSTITNFSKFSSTLFESLTVFKRLDKTRCVSSSKLECFYTTITTICVLVKYHEYNLNRLKISRFCSRARRLPIVRENRQVNNRNEHSRLAPE